MLKTATSTKQRVPVKGAKRQERQPDAKIEQKQVCKSKLDFKKSDMHMNPEEEQPQLTVQSSPFVEKHMSESLDVGPEVPHLSVIFYQMLN
jgi:hypothetical protein